MDEFRTDSNWAHVQERWLDYAQRIKIQWPEISFSEILATRGSRERLCECVAGTYGLQAAEAERAVAIWQESQIVRGAWDATETETETGTSVA